MRLTPWQRLREFLGLSFVVRSEPGTTHIHGDSISQAFNGTYTEHEHEGGDRPHTHPDNPYVNPPPDWPH